MDRKYSNPSNTYCFAKNCNIEDPKKFTKEKLKGALRNCKIRQEEVRKSSKGLRKVYLRDCLIDARAKNQVVRAFVIKQKIYREHNVRMWYLIQITVKDPGSPTVLKVRTFRNGKHQPTPRKETLIDSYRNSVNISSSWHTELP